MSAPSIAAARPSQIRPVTAEQPRDELGASISDVLARWAIEGPLVREATGIATLDLATAGGVPYGDAWAIVAPPDGAKTAFLVQVANAWAARGVVVGYLAADAASGTDAIVTRLGQRLGYSRKAIEDRSDATLAALARELGKLPLKIYGPDVTIEAAAADVAHRAEISAIGDERRPRGALFVDSLHTSSSSAEDPRAGARDQIAGRVRSYGASVARYRLAGIATAEMARATYDAPDDARANLAAGAETRVLDYGPAAKIVARRESDGRFSFTIARCKSGGTGTVAYLELDTARMILSEGAPPEPMPSVAERRAEKEQAKENERRQRDDDDDACAREILAKQPNATVRELVAHVRSGRACGSDRAHAAVARTRRPA